MKSLLRHRILSAASICVLALLLSACLDSKTKKKTGDGSATNGSCSDISSSLHLVGAARPETVAWAARTVQKRLQSQIEARAVKSSAEGGAEHIDLRFYVNDTPLCQHEARAHVVKGWPLISGALPDDVNIRSADTATWGQPEEVLPLFADRLNLKASQLTLSSATPCLALQDRQLEAAWEVNLRDEHDLPYVGIATAQRLINFEPRFFNASGKAKLYDQNPLANKLVTITIDDLDGQGGLCTTRFASVVPESIELAHNTSLDFAYEPTDARFPEVNVFANAELMAAWLTKGEHGYTWSGRVELHSHYGAGTDDSSSINNAAYIPAEFTGSGRAQVRIGDGDGSILRNLALDADVVGHELGHHVVFRVLKSAEGESLVIHEGLADYLQFARSNNPCLGESICPTGTPVCWQSECLRTASNSLKYTDTTLPSQAHKRSQFLSGMLWDLGNGAMTRDQVTKVVFKGVNYLLQTSSYKDLIVALMTADKEVHGGTYACKIYDQAVARGLQSVLAGVDCNAYKTR